MSAKLSSNARALTVKVYGQAESDGTPCTKLASAQANETAKQVVITVMLHNSCGASGPFWEPNDFRIGVGAEHTAQISLRKPLRKRTLIDSEGNEVRIDH
ncbi:hypothetical protein ABT294_45785 [Nonomuraea sp. NPDC000554]|uniref:hypothetical protein n=1 Tax=Nonomuraea sp. NPDC000554 TaxID=3154259 RepID=UPI00331F1416